MKNFILFFMLIASTSLFGQAIPNQLDYQGILKDASGNLLSGDYALTFKIYNTESGGTALWSEIQVLPVQQGVFNAHLGSVTPITTVPFDREHFLGITVGAASELTPRTRLTPSPYSFMAMDVLDNSITSPKIVDGTITTADLSNNAVTSEKTVDEAGIAENSNTTTHQLAGITTMTTICTLTVTTPGPGYIVLDGKTIAWLAGTTAQNEIYMQIDETEGGAITSPFWTKAGLQAYASTGQAFFPVNCQRTFSKPAGTYTFYLEAQSVSGNGAGATTNVYQTQLRAIYYPTAYGTVESPENIKSADESLSK